MLSFVQPQAEFSHFISFQQLPSPYIHNRPLSYPPSLPPSLSTHQMPFLHGHCSGGCDYTHTTTTAASNSVEHNKMTPSPAAANGVALPQDTSVAQALEIARESPDGAEDRTVATILEDALASLWNKIEAEPDSYVLTRDEFAVFNYFQSRFRDNKKARAARSRYWDNTSA